MQLSDRLRSFALLGDRLRSYHENSVELEMMPLTTAAQNAFLQNPWFTPEHIRIALNNLGHALNRESLERWISPYRDRIERVSTTKTIGVVMAGNIPAVGFHDFLCVLISGNRLVAKLSSSDDQLFPAFAGILTDCLPEWYENIVFTSGKLEKFDAIITTGSTNTSRYFEYYFGKYPHIIRKNRNSVALLAGIENNHDLDCLAADIMLFFGKGCRSISKVYIPKGYNFTGLIRALDKYDYFSNHHQYYNNYEYYKSIYLVSQVPFIDTGFLLLKEDHALASPIAVLHFEYYNSVEDVTAEIIEYSDSIQCVISKGPLPVQSLRPGEGQNPVLWDYADQVDTMEFLLF